MSIAPESGTRSGGGWGYPIRPRIPRPDPTRPDPLVVLAFRLLLGNPFPERHLGDGAISHGWGWAKC